VPISDAHIWILLRGLDEAVRRDPEHELTNFRFACLHLRLPLRVQCPGDIAADEVRRPGCADDGKSGSAADARVVSLNSYVLFSCRLAGVIDRRRVALQVDAVPILVRREVLTEEPAQSGALVLDGIHPACTDRLV